MSSLEQSDEGFHACVDGWADRVAGSPERLRRKKDS